MFHMNQNHPDFDLRLLLCVQGWVCTKMKTNLVNEMKLNTKLKVIAISGSMVGKNFGMADQNVWWTAASVIEISPNDQVLLIDASSSILTSSLLKIALREFDVVVSELACKYNSTLIVI